MAGVTQAALDEVMPEVSEICRTRPSLLKEIREMAREAVSRKDGLVPLSLSSLAKLDRGKSGRQFSYAQSVIMQNIERYPVHRGLPDHELPEHDLGRRQPARLVF